MELRPYQQLAAERVEAQWHKHGHQAVLLCIPTGGGKTEVAIALADRHIRTRASRVLVLTERKNLCHQWVARLRRHGFHDIGVMQAQNTVRTYAKVLVATAQTISRRGVPEDVGLVVMDESHLWHQAHDRVLSVTGSTAKVLGLSATPLRLGLGRRFTKLVNGVTIRELIEQGFLVRPRYYAPKAETLQAALEGVHVLAGDYKADELSAAMRAKALIGDVVSSWKRLAHNRQTIAFCVDQAHAQDLADDFNAAGIAAAVIIDRTEDQERERLFAAFDVGEVRVLCNVGVLAIGYDSPVASCAILARPSLSLSLHVQQGGRVLRPFAGKADALILDHACNTLRHGLLEDFVPPEDLSEVDKGTDSRPRKDAAVAWVCRFCETVNVIHEDFCDECGEPRRRHTMAVVLNGELVDVEVRHHEPLPGPTQEDVKRFYLMARRYCEDHNLSPGLAFYKTAERFKAADKANASKLIPWAWRDLPSIPPDDETARWLRNDYLRYRIRSLSATRTAN